MLHLKAFFSDLPSSLSSYHLCVECTKLYTTPFFKIYNIYIFFFNSASLDMPFILSFCFINTAWLFHFLSAMFNGLCVHTWFSAVLFLLALYHGVQFHGESEYLYVLDATSQKSFSEILRYIKWWYIFPERFAFISVKFLETLWASDLLYQVLTYIRNSSQSYNIEWTFHHSLLHWHS